MQCILLLDKITWRPSTPNFNQTGQKLWKVRTEINLCPKSKVRLSLSHFSQHPCMVNNNFLKNSYTTFLTKMACGLVTDIKSQTDNWMDSLQIYILYVLHKDQKTENFCKFSPWFFQCSLPQKLNILPSIILLPMEYHKSHDKLPPCLLGDITSATISQLLLVLQQQSITFTATSLFLTSPYGM